MGAYFDRPLSAVTTRWRIYHEESAELNPRDERTDFEELRGTGDTRIYRHGQDVFAVSSDVGKTQARLRRIPGLRPKSGSVLLFADALLDTVAEAIHARKRRQLSPEHLEAFKRAAIGTQYRAKKRPEPDDADKDVP